MNSPKLTIDVREEIRAGREPFSKIMQTAGQVRAGESFRLIAPFEPSPLFPVLGGKGFSHSSNQQPTGEWVVTFQRQTEPDPTRTTGPATAAAPRLAAIPDTVVEVDARGLEPPQPLAVILEAVSQLPTGAALSTRTDRRPMHLYGHLAERGFVGETEETPDGTYLTHIHRS